MKKEIPLTYEQQLQKDCPGLFLLQESLFGQPNDFKDRIRERPRRQFHPQSNWLPGKEETGPTITPTGDKLRTNVKPEDMKLGQDAMSNSFDFPEKGEEEDSEMPTNIEEPLPHEPSAEDLMKKHLTRQVSKAIRELDVDQLRRLADALKGMK